MEEISDKFLAGAIRMATDGMAPEFLEKTMSLEIDAVDARHIYYKSILENIGKYAPAFGMMGTVVGLVLMLADFDPSTVGLGMADKLGFLNEFEKTSREIILNGVLSIQAAENPRVIKGKLLTYIPANRHPIEQYAAA